MSGAEALRAFAAPAAGAPAQGEAGALAAEVECAFAALMGGDAGQAEASAPALHARAAKLGAAAMVVEVAVLRALTALARGDLHAATELARRAARMAQSEALPEGEYLAHLALARIRRHAGRPHLAAHILGALAQVAPPHWRGWLSWELLLAGSERRAGELLVDIDAQAASGRAALALQAALAAAQAGDRPGFGRAVDEAAAATRGWVDARREVAALAAALDPAREESPDQVSSWRCGAVAQTPSGLHGVGAPQTLDVEGDLNVAYVVALPGAPGRRVLPPGLGLSPASRRLDRELPSGGGGGRGDLGLAVLALAGPAGLPRADFFQAVYGFPFSPRIHQDALDVLIHRMRQRLGETGEIVRGGETLVIALTLHGAVVIPDVRCALPITERVLRALALLSRASAQEAATVLGLALRTVQKALAELVADGSCTSERVGNRVSYRLHDTTFTEVTALSGR